jgi:hypothetical protein
MLIPCLLPAVSCANRAGRIAVLDKHPFQLTARDAAPGD